MGHSYRFGAGASLSLITHVGSYQYVKSRTERTSECNPLYPQCKWKIHKCLFVATARLQSFVQRCLIPNQCPNGVVLLECPKVKHKVFRKTYEPSFIGTLL